MDAAGLALGGEQSGHVFREMATTGDGLVTTVQVLDALVRSGQTLQSPADAAMTRLPQVLRNVRVKKRDPRIVEAIAAGIAAVEAELGETG